MYLRAMWDWSPSHLRPRIQISPTIGIPVNPCRPKPTPPHASHLALRYINLLPEHHHHFLLLHSFLRSFPFHSFAFQLSSALVLVRVPSLATFDHRHPLPAGADPDRPFHGLCVIRREEDHRAATPAARLSGRSRNPNPSTAAACGLPGAPRRRPAPCPSGRRLRSEPGTGPEEPQPRLPSCDPALESRVFDADGRAEDAIPSSGPDRLLLPFFLF